MIYEGSKEAASELEKMLVASEERAMEYINWWIQNSEDSIWRGVRQVAVVPTGGRFAEKVAVVAIKFFESEGLSVIYPKLNGRHQLIDSSGTLVDAGTSRQIARRNGFDGRLPFMIMVRGVATPEGWRFTPKR